jgi:hypothetical protein
LSLNLMASFRIIFPILFFSAPIDAVWLYADFVLSQSEKRGVEIFMRRHEELVIEREEKVVNFLQQYRNAYLIYLEYLVNERHSKVTYS